jgi:hypothetical protein
MGAASPWPSSRTGNDNRLPGSTEEGKRFLVSSAFDLEFWDNFNSIQFNSIVRCQPFCHWLHLCLLAVDCSPSRQTLLLPEKSRAFGFCFRISTKLWRVVVKGAGCSQNKHPSKVESRDIFQVSVGPVEVRLNGAGANFRV